MVTAAALIVSVFFFVGRAGCEPRFPCKPRDGGFCVCVSQLVIVALKLLRTRSPSNGDSLHLLLLVVGQRVYLGSTKIPAKVALQLTWEQIGGAGPQAGAALRGVALLNRLIERQNREQLLLATTPGRRHVIRQHACKPRGCANTELCVAAMKARESHGLMTPTDSEDSVHSAEICHVACFSLLGLTFSLKGRKVTKATNTRDTLIAHAVYFRLRSDRTKLRTFCLLRSSVSQASILL